MGAEGVVGTGADGQTLQKWLRKAFPTVPLSAIFRALRRGAVRVNGRRAAAGQTLKTGDRVQTPFTDQPTAAPKPPPNVRGALRVLFEDKDVIALEKPSGVASQPGRGVPRGASAAERLFGMRGEGTALCHRLDMGTSGILVGARHGRALRALHGSLRNGEWHKTYLALALGHASDFPKKAVFQQAIEEMPGGGARLAEDGKMAHTEAEIVEAGNGLLLLSVQIFTGRRHQIRLHLASAGFPIVGDNRYGNFEENRRRGAARLMLHAAQVQLPHPATGQLLTIESKAPRAFAAALLG